MMEREPTYALISLVKGDPGRSEGSQRRGDRRVGE